MIKAGKYTTEEAMAALSLTVEEMEEMERNPDTREQPPPIGKYGSLFLNFLREKYPGRHAFLLGETVLRDVCAEVDREAREMMETVQSQLRAKKPRPRMHGRAAGEARDQAKGDFMATVQYETAIRDQAEEIVLNEIVYKRR